MNRETHTWNGLNSSCEYCVFDVYTVFNAVPANFIYARSTPGGERRAIHIGTTGDLCKRTLSEHHKKHCIEHCGATHIHLHQPSSSEAARLAEEADLITALGPPCNSFGTLQSY